MIKPRASPYLLLTLAAFFWSCNWIVGRGFSHDVPPLAMTFYRWFFALLILAPDLAFLAMPLGSSRMAMTYDVAHSYTWPLILIGAGLLTTVSWLLPVGLIWAAHIGLDRALGYGLKYPESIETTHLGLIGKSRKAAQRANAG